MIESGTHTPGITAADFGLPAHTALRCERPAAGLRPFFVGYSVLDSDATLFKGKGSWLLPGWATIWIGLTAGPIGVTIRNRRYGRVGSANVFGVTSRAIPATTSGGITVAVHVSPLGWARFLGSSSAELMRDRLMPLDELMPAGWGDELIAIIGASDCGPAVKGLLDDFFLARLPPPHPDETLIAQITSLLHDPSSREFGEAVAELGLSRQTLLRVTKRHFGFPPKMLVMRARFLRAICDMIVSGQQPGPALVPDGYHDASHFTRDGTRFLGMTPRRFLATDMTYLQAVLRARSLVFGTLTPAPGHAEEAP